MKTKLILSLIFLIAISLLIQASTQPPEFPSSFWGEVIGAKLTKTIDSLTPITPDIVEGAKAIENATDVEVTDADEKAVLKYNKNAGDVIRSEDLENPMHFEKFITAVEINPAVTFLTVIYCL